MRFFWHRRAQKIAGSLSLSALLGVAAVGCKGTDPDVTPPPDPAVTAPLTSVDPVAESSMFWSPLDATPSPEGDVIYFTAMTEAGPAVLRVEPGAEPTVLTEGETMASPFAIVPSFDGATLFVTDSAAEGETETTGRVFALPSSGGEPQPLSAADGTMPKSLTVVQQDGRDVLYFTGTDPMSDEAPAVFRMFADGTGLEVIASGEPLVDPSGIAVTKEGTVYVADSNGASDGTAAILQISNGAVSELVRDVRVGYPAGIALDFDETALFVSGLAKNDPTSVVYHVVLATKEVTAIDDGIAHNSESAGVHRAHKADVYAWANADGSEDEPAGGTVYLLKGPRAQ